LDTNDLINVTISNGLALNDVIFNFTNAGSMTAGAYKLIDYVGAFSGSISSMSFGAVPGGFQYSLIDNASTTSIDLIVSPLLAGDFNNNGLVDAADYALWRKAVGQPAGTLPNDDTGAAIGEPQYALWKLNFGNATSGAAALAAVPEPAGFSCALLFLVMAGCCRPRYTCWHRGLRRSCEAAGICILSRRLAPHGH
jgi:hypothetical protein